LSSRSSRSLSARRSRFARNSTRTLTARSDRPLASPKNERVPATVRSRSPLGTFLSAARHSAGGGPGLGGDFAPAPKSGAAATRAAAPHGNPSYRSRLTARRRPRR
jgi:hypothetical protein